MGNDVEPTAGWRERLRRRGGGWPLLRGLGWLALAGWLVMSGAAWLWPDNLAPQSVWASVFGWVVFMVSVTRFHGWIGLLVLAGIAWLIGARRLFRACVLAVVITGWPVAGVLWSYVRPRPVSGANAPTLTVLSVNLMYGRTDPELVVRQVHETQADVVLFQEWTPGAERQMTLSLRVTHPYHAMIAQDDAFGSAIFSRLPIEGLARRYPPTGRWSVPQANATVVFDGRPVDIASVHVLPPVSHSYVREQRSQVAHMAGAAGESLRRGRAVIYAGDFNATPGTAHVRAMLGAGLDEAHRAAGRGRGATWPAIGAASYLPGIRIDHVFFGGGLRCTGTRVLDSGGSDHHPVVATFVWDVDSGTPRP